MKLGLWIAAGAMLGLGSSAYAQEKSCTADSMKLCPKVEPGSSAEMKCLKSHLDELSSACKKHVQQAKIKPEEQKQEKSEEQMPPQPQGTQPLQPEGMQPQGTQPQGTQPQGTQPLPTP
jgi:hypothetical protein